MAAKDFMKPQVAVAVAVTAAISSPRIRRFVRRGMVYGVAGALMAGDAISSAARGAALAAREAAASAASEETKTAEPTAALREGKDTQSGEASADG